MVDFSASKKNLGKTLMEVSRDRLSWWRFWALDRLPRKFWQHPAESQWLGRAEVDETNGIYLIIKIEKQNKHTTLEYNRSYNYKFSMGRYGDMGGRVEIFGWSHGFTQFLRF